MKIDEFNFHLPEQLIAQTPLEKRTASKMLVVNKSNNTFTHDTFTNLTSYLQKGDCIVFNDTKVIPARLYGIKKDTGANIERSEEHTSELQSRGHLVCRLLLEKK